MALTGLKSEPKVPMAKCQELSNLARGLTFKTLEALEMPVK